MADALLSPPVGAAFWAGTVAAIGLATKKLKAEIDDRMVPLMGVLGAFIFASQMINFTIPGTGSSGHLGGGMILAVLIGPAAAFLIMASVLTVQALFFADGGLLALGCNIWNLGIYPCFVAYPLIYRPLAGDGTSRRRMLVAAVAAAVVGLQLGAFSVVLQTVLSGKSELPFRAFALVMQPIHLAIGIVEGLVTAAVIAYVRSVRPDLFSSGSREGASRPLTRTLLSVLLLALLIAGGLSWFASTKPDGLEWAVAKITGSSGPAAADRGVLKTLRDAQERTAIMPDYAFKGTAGAEAPADRTNAGGTSTAGILGAVIVLAVSVAVGAAIRALGKRRR